MWRLGAYLSFVTCSLGNVLASSLGVAVKSLSAPTRDREIAFQRALYISLHAIWFSGWLSRSIDIEISH